MLTVDLRVTSHCDMDCSFCHGAPKGIVDSPVSDVLKALDRLKLVGVERVVISGGEPMVRKETPDIIRHAASLGFSVYLSTNGLWFAEKYPLIEDYLDWIGLPLDGTSVEMNKRMTRKPRVFESTLSILGYLKDRKNLKHKVKVGTVVSRINIDDILGIGHLLFEQEWYQPDVWRLYQFAPRGVGKSNEAVHEISDERFHKIVDLARSTFGSKVSPLSNEDHDFSYFFLNPDMNLVTASRYEFPELGNILNMSETELSDLFDRKLDISQRGRSNREWLTT